MYGKIYGCTFERSLFGAGSHVFAVMAYVIAKTVDSRVELNPAFLAAVIGDSKERIQQAIDYLSAPDPNSTHSEYEGRRLVKEGQFQYFVPTHLVYRSIANAEELREANRARVARHREKKRAAENGPPESVGDPPRDYSPTKPPAARFVPPTQEEVEFQCTKIGLPLSTAKAFIDFYTGKGWMIGKNKMVSWPHALNGWKLKREEEAQKNKPNPAGLMQEGMTKEDFLRGM